MLPDPNLNPYLFYCPKQNKTQYTHDATSGRIDVVRAAEGEAAFEEVAIKPEMKKKRIIIASGVFNNLQEDSPSERIGEAKHIGYQLAALLKAGFEIDYVKTTSPHHLLKDYSRFG